MGQMSGNHLENTFARRLHCLRQLSRATTQTSCYSTGRHRPHHGYTLRIRLRILTEVKPGIPNYYSPKVLLPMEGSRPTWYTHVDPWAPQVQTQTASWVVQQSLLGSQPVTERQTQLEGKYSLESTDPRESEIRAHLRPQFSVEWVELRMYYLFISVKWFVGLFTLEKIPGLRRF